ncbi:MAG: hypothetical protein LBT47_13520 [Deltaproteobacteria bacterium]|jgi:hypothetical protein|nr:hypothetical protein [Deltaproteobacteria bacterium]
MKEDTDFLDGDLNSSQNSSYDFDRLVIGIQKLVENRENGLLVSPEILSKLLEMLLKFAKDFETGTSNENFFLSLTNIEDLAIDLQAKFKNITADLLLEKISQINQKNQIEKKKLSTKTSE